MSEYIPENAPLPAGDLPEWLPAVLAASRFLNEEVPEAFHQRCGRAAEVALTLARLQRERERVGFVLLPLRDYLDGMARGLGASLTAVLTWFGLEEWSRADEGVAGALARLGHALGMSLRETLAHVRLGFACDQGYAPLLSARGRAAGTVRGRLEEGEALLGEIEAQYNTAALSALRRTEAAIQAIYQAFADDRDGNAEGES